MVLDITQTNKIAFTWSVNDFALFVNGVKRASDVSGTTFSANTLTELQFNGGAGAGNICMENFNKYYYSKPVNRYRTCNPNNIIK
jgi:hypothetical protein